MSLLALVGVLAVAHALEPRVPLAVDPVSLPPLPDAPMAGRQLSVKLKDEVRGRATADGGVRSLAGADLRALRAVAAAHGLRFRPLIGLSDQRMDALEARAAARSGRAQPDLRGMLVVELDDPSPGALLAAGQALEALGVVEYAHIRVIGVPPPGDIGSTTPLYEDRQDYHGPDPGIDAEFAWSVGATGAHIRLSDAEYGWIGEHEDLVDRDLNQEDGTTVPSWVASYGYDEHGTAVLGETSAVDNEYGCVGLVPDAEVATYPEWTDEVGSRRVEAIVSAIADSAAGDVVMLEMQDYGAGGGYGPAEVDPDVWTAVRAGADAGVVVVAAAGNGAQNLDSAAYASYRDWGDSGAIIVGAGSGDTSHDAASFSTYGARVDLQGWGDYTVFTLGYGDYAKIDRDREQTYTATFAGTSSATPIVASAVVAVMDYVVGGGGAPLSPEVVRELLIDTGVPQGSGGEIGPLPDLQAAITELDSDLDGYADQGYGGIDCDDDDGAVYPGAEETWYDGVDGDCAGGDDYDQDTDGHASDAHGGEDCDDTDGTVFPGAPETWYDGVDGDCAGDDDYDQDADGHAWEAYNGDDCDDLSAAVHPGAEELEDGIDSDCDGADTPVVDTGGEGGEGGEGGQDLEPKPRNCACASSTDAAPLWPLLAGLAALTRRRGGKR